MTIRDLFESLVTIWDSEVNLSRNLAATSFKSFTLLFMLTVLVMITDEEWFDLLWFIVLLTTTLLFFASATIDLMISAYRFLIELLNKIRPVQSNKKAINKK